MSEVTESIYNGQSVIVPLADVQHIEKHKGGGLMVITKHTKWCREADFWENNIFIPETERDVFIAAWCRYRHELEINTLAMPEPPVAA